MEGLTAMKIESYRSFSGFDEPTVARDMSPGIGRDCGVVDPCSPLYRSYLRAVRFLAEQCENFFGGDPSYGVEKFIKDIIVGKVMPNQDGFVVLAPAGCGDRGRMTGVWLDEKPARLIREVQRDLDLSRDTNLKFFGQAGTLTACGRSLEQVRNQFFVDCFSECAQPASNSTVILGPSTGMGPVGSRMKANTTECVPVPSSEHVAEIVGKKGGKIKNIRAETNTYIKTPKRDEEPVFVITGRKEDVALAKQKITVAADHFTQLREARRQNPGGIAGMVPGSVGSGPVVGGGALGVLGPLGPPKRDGDITVSVEVPYEFVGLVVGQKGATIKRIQQDTNTYITTPSRRHRPIFEVVGQPLEVERAREAIRAHINSRVEKFRVEGTASGGGSFAGMMSSGAGMFASGSTVGGFMGGSSSVGMYDDLLLGSDNGTLSSLIESSTDLTSSYPTSWSTATGSSGSSCGSGSSRPLAPGSCVGSGGRLSAFCQLPVDTGIDHMPSLDSGFRNLSLLSDSVGPSGVIDTSVGATSYWQAPERSACSLPPVSGSGDPADPLCRRLSEDGYTEPQRAISNVLFNFGDHLGWSSSSSCSLYSGAREPGTVGPPRDTAGAGSSETLNSDSGVELASPPPPALMIDSVGAITGSGGANFGPIGSKRSSPTSVGSSD